MDVSIKPTKKGVHLYFSENGRTVSDFLLSWGQVDWLKYQLMGAQVRYKKA
jgi:hypothetical protein